MTVAVVIATRDRPERVDGAIGAVRAAMRAGDELVVVDSDSRVPLSVDGVRVVRVDRPGAGRARNAGVDATTAPIVAFTDDDCRPERGWIAAVEHAFAGDERIGVVAGRVVPDRDDLAFVLSVSGGTEPRTLSRGDDPGAVAHGANLAFRRAAFDAVDGFDEAFGPGARFANGEDYDIVWRVLRAGWTGRFEPAAVVTHVQWRGRVEALRAYYRYGVGDGAFAMKARDADPAAGARLLRDRLWATGVRRIGRDLLDRNESSAAADAAKLAGVLSGAVRGRFTRWRP